MAAAPGEAHVSQLVTAFGEDAAVDEAPRMAVFSEQELHDILGILETSEVGALGGLARPSSTTDLMSLGLHFDTATIASTLQFQPHSPNPSGRSGERNSFSSMSGGPSSEQLQAQHTLQAASGAQRACLPQQPAGAPGNSLSAPPQGFSIAVPNNAAAMQLQHSGSLEQRSEVSTRTQPSHSSVEKQRRDRINALIDELRDLVPPQKGTSVQAAGVSCKGDASAEARRPKHVVLADTIALLRQVKLSALRHAPAAATAPSAVPASTVKEDPESMRIDDLRSSESSQASIMPSFPVALSSFAGVTVEQAASDPATMYVQVKCRDRRGLLSDIINALRVLPVEVRTAAIVTCNDGMIRDVFEIRVDDPGLKPEDVQNVVHDGLYNQRVRQGDGQGKKHKAQDL